MDDISITIVLSVVSLFISLLIGIIIAYLHMINEKMSEVKTKLVEIDLKMDKHKDK